MTRVRHGLYLLTPFLLTPAVAWGSPTMIRAGYTSCALCHVAPQGGGLLTDYGKGIDKAQSLARNEYVPDPDAARRPFRHDVRALLVHSTSTSVLGERSPGRLWTQVMYRHMHRVGERSRVSMQAGIELVPVSTMGPGSEARFIVSQARWEYRAREGLELAVGRGAVPDPLGVPDRDPLFRRGGLDAPPSSPTHAQLYLWTDRFELAPYVFGPGGEASLDARERGAGVFGGVNLGPRAVAGVSARVRRHDGRTEDAFGLYTRLGFGSWGVLTLHELGHETNGADAARRYAGYTQVFAAPREWVVTSLTLERLHTAGYEETRLRPEVQLRLTNAVTLLVNMRHDLTHARADRPMRVYGVQLALKGLQ